MYKNNSSVIVLVIKFIKNTSNQEQLISDILSERIESSDIFSKIMIFPGYEVKLDTNCDYWDITFEPKKLVVDLYNT